MHSLAPIFWAFVGLETGAMVAGVVDDPERNVPLATPAASPSPAWSTWCLRY